MVGNDLSAKRNIKMAEYIFQGKLDNTVHDITSYQGECFVGRGEAFGRIGYRDYLERDPRAPGLQGKSRCAPFLDSGFALLLHVSLLHLILSVVEDNKLQIRVMFTIIYIFDKYCIKSCVLE